MKKTFNKIDLPANIPEIYPLRVKFEDQDYIFDFSVNGDNEINRYFAKVFYSKHITLSKNTRERNFGSINKFLNHLNKDNIKQIQDVSPLVIVSFATWLDHSNFSLNTKYKHYNTIESCLYDIKRLNDQIKNLSIPTNPFKNPHSESVEPDKLTTEQLKQVLKICYEKIDSLMLNFRESQKKIKQVDAQLRSGNEFNWKDKYHITHYFYNKYGYAPFLNSLSHHEQGMISNMGGVNHLLNAITPDVHMLLPFYLVLMVELAANSDALRQIKMDCVNEDPLFEDRVLILWNKARASEPQKRNVLKNKKYGAYQIIEWVKEFTQHTRKVVSDNEKEFLFICRGEIATNPFSLAHEQSFKQALKFFCKDNQLSFKFNPSDIRPTVLTEMYKQRKDIVAVSKIANHKNIDTTLLYVADKETRKENRAYLSERQNNIINDIVKPKEQSIVHNITNAENIGFICKNPIIENKVCINWMAELTNPNLIIPDNPIYLARIIALKNAITKVEHLMHRERFKLLYLPVVELIDKDILPKFKNETLNEASLLAKNITIPSLGDY